MFNTSMLLDEEVELIDDFMLANVNKTESKVKNDSFKNKNKASKTKTVSPKQRKVLNVIKEYGSVKKENEVINSADLKSAEEKQAMREMLNVEKQIPHATKEFKEVLDLIEEYTKSNGYDNEQ